MRVTTAVTSTGRAVDQALVGVGATQYRIPGQGSPLCSRNHSLWSLLQCSAGDAGGIGGLGF